MDQAKRRSRVENGEEVGPQFSKEELEGETRRPKRKVAVMFGYAGSGYKGLQMNLAEKTIEGDVFKALVKAGAVSKANADDPKKSSFVRCARTDKGVHAAGNVISLKMIVEDKDIVDRINTHLPAQIRVWGIQRTNQSFSCYQRCDSRWYEYLLPTYALLPPHPASFLGKKLVEDAKKEGVLATYQERIKDVASFWEEVDKEYIEPILNKLSPELRAAALIAVHQNSEHVQKLEDDDAETTAVASTVEPTKAEDETDEHIVEPATTDVSMDDAAAPTVSDREGKADVPAEPITHSELETGNTTDVTASQSGAKGQDAKHVSRARKALTPLELAVKEIKAAYIRAKKAHRLPKSSQEMLQNTLSQFVGTKNFHNYTKAKSFKDPSSKRHIRSFVVAEQPIIIGDAEWLSLKVHGQSFMMHQIRKMVAMAVLILRCGASIDLIRKSFESQKISIPKAPGLGLLLERPVFFSYNEQAVKDFGWEKIDFDNYKMEIDAFKQEQIYNRIFREEDAEHM